MAEYIAEERQFTMSSMTKGYTVPPRKAGKASETEPKGEMYGPPQFRTSDYIMNQFDELINKRTGKEATAAEERMWFKAKRQERRNN